MGVGFENVYTQGLTDIKECSGEPPIYAKVKIKQGEIERARKNLDNKKYNHSEWFFGAKDVQRWFAYTYGYQLSKAYSEKVKK